MLRREIEKLSESIVEGIELLDWIGDINIKNRLNNTLAGR